MWWRLLKRLLPRKWSVYRATAYLFAAELFVLWAFSPDLLRPINPFGRTCADLHRDARDAIARRAADDQLAAMARARPTFLPPWDEHGQPRRLRVLFLADGAGAAPFEFQYAAALRHPHVAAEWWRWGAPGYDRQRTLRENLVRRYGGVHFDVIYHAAAGASRVLAELKAIADAGEAVVAIHTAGACAGGRCQRLMADSGAHVVLMSHMVDMPRFRNETAGRVIVHAPHAADPSVFYAAGSLAYRQGALLLVAPGRGGTYPLRERWARLIADGRLPGASIYEIGDDGRADGEDELGAQAARRRRIARYAEALQGAKVVLLDSSTAGYAFPELAEAVMAGCLVISDLPHERPDLFSEAVVTVGPDTPDDDLVHLVDYWLSLDHNQDRAARVRLAQSPVLAELTWDRTIDRLIDGVNAYTAGDFGMRFSGPVLFSTSADPRHAPTSE